MATLLDLLAGDVLPRVAKIVLALGVGVYLANLAVAFGAVRRIAALGRPLTRPANLPVEVGTAILTTTASTTAGYGMLAEFRESGVLDDRATLVAVTINTFFGFAQHILTFYAPVLIPILGLRVGLLYVGVRGLIALAITGTGILAGALVLSAENVDRAAITDVEEPETETATTRTKLRNAATDTAGTLRDIVPRLVLIYTVVVVLVARVDVRQVTAAADPLASAIGLPSTAVPAIAVFAIDTTNGAAFLAPFVENGTFTARQAVATMLVGGIISFAVTTFKRSIPFQYGVWGAEFGAKVVAVNTALKVVWIGVAVALLLGL